VTKDNAFITIPSELDFMACTLASGHFCSLTSPLYHSSTTDICLAALFMKDHERIVHNCRLSLTSVSPSTAHYLDNGLWAIAAIVPQIFGFGGTKFYYQ